MDLNKLKIFEFKLKNMKEGPTIVMIAKRGSGKSWICRDLMHHFRHIPGGIVLAPTDKQNPFYKYFFPDLYIHYDIKPEIFEKILTRQTLMKMKMKTKAKQGKKVDASALLVMDDCLAEAQKWKKDENLRIILMNGRHYMLTYILTMQSPLGIDNTLRDQFDYVFLLKDNKITNKKRIMDHYAGMFENQKVFNKVFAECTKDHRCMVIDNRSGSDEISKCVYWFKAKDRSFTFGSKEFVSMHKKFYDPEYMDNNMWFKYGKPVLNKKKKDEPELKIEMIEKDIMKSSKKTEKN